MGKLFGTDGVRGVADKDLTPTFVEKMGKAIGTFLADKRVLIGRDARTSGERIQSSVMAALVSTGCKVYDAGLVPTPTIQYGVRFHKMDGGVVITASHNPPEYNGIKVLSPRGVEIPRHKELEIEDIYFKEKFRLKDPKDYGSIGRAPDVFEPYKEGIRKLVDVEAIRRKSFRVVVDPANSVGALVIPDVLRDLGCKVITINSTIDGTFPGRLSEPRPEYLSDLASAVKQNRADLGMASDGDGDRAIFADETGKVYWGDKSLAIIERVFLSEHPGEKIVTPVSSSMLIEDVASEYGGEVVWTVVGSVDVAWKMVEIGAKLGGEENGGVIYGPHQYVRDGAMTAALMLDILAKTGKRLSELVEELPVYHQLKDKLHCPDELKTRVLEELQDKVEAERVDRIDGVKLWFADGSWILIRPSGTEPIYRLYAEAKSAKRVRQIVEKYKEVVGDAIKKLL